MGRAIGLFQIKNPRYFVSMSIGARPEFPRPKDKTFEKSLMDYENPLALINLVSADVRAAIEKIPAAWMKMDEDEFIEANGEPKTTVYQLRHQFWTEFDRAVDSRSQMSMVNIYTACCSRTYWHGVLMDVKALAFIMIPPASYFAMTEELLARGLKRVRDILSLPVKRPNGEVDARAGELILKTVMFLDMRLKGGFLHRSEQVSLNVNRNMTTIQQDGGGMAGNPLQNLDDEIKALQAQIDKAGSSGGLPDPSKFMSANKSSEVIDVESETTDAEVVEKD
jgi:hypothetical protein